MCVFVGGGGQNGGSGRGGGNPQTALLSGPPQHQLFVNPNQIQFSTGTQNFTFPQGDNSGGQLQLNTGGPSLLLQPPVNFVTDQLGLGQLITQAAQQSQQNLQNIMSLNSVLAPSIQLQDNQSQAGPQQSKQRVFTGTVTKIHVRALIYLVYIIITTLLNNYIHFCRITLDLSMRKYFSKWGL